MYVNGEATATETIDGEPAGVSVGRYVPLASVGPDEPPPPQHASTPAGRYVMYFYIETCPHCQDARPKVDAWRKTLPRDVHYVENIAKWRDREGAAFAYRIESVPSFVIDGKYLVAIESWDPADTDAAIALVSRLAGLEP